MTARSRSTGIPRSVRRTVALYALLGLVGALVLDCGEGAAPLAATVSPAPKPPAASSPALTPGASATTPAPPPSNPLLPSTPVMNAGWPAYSDSRLGVEFRYPPPCPPRDNQGAIEVGPRISLAANESTAGSLDAYVDELLRRQDWRIESRVRGTLGPPDNEPTIRVEYRFGGTSRFGVAFFVARGSMVYVWQFTSGGGATECDSAEVFVAIIDSFRLTDVVR